MKSVMKSRSRIYKGYTKECHTARAVDFISKCMPVMPLAVKHLSQLRLRNVRGSVTLSAPSQRSAGCFLCTVNRVFEEVEGGWNDTQTLSSNPCGVICTSVSLIDDY